MRSGIHALGALVVHRLEPDRIAHDADADTHHQRRAQNEQRQLLGNLHLGQAGQLHCVGSDRPDDGRDVAALERSRPLPR
jgi:hypothetical protein